MKKALRISVSIFLMALAVGITQIPVKQVTADEETVSKDSEFQMNGSILVKYTGTAATVSVPAEVTVIGEEAFAGNTTMKTLNFKGDKVEEIAYNAFSGCTALEKAILPDSVLEIGNGAFEDCSSLKKLTLGKELYKLGIGCFTGCKALEGIELAEDNSYFSVTGEGLYNQNKSKLYLVFLGKNPESYAMPGTVEEIAPYAFWGCETIQSVSLSSSLAKISDYAFANCKSLTGISVPYSVGEIGIKAFADCIHLENVAIPATVTVIHDTAFDGCPKLKIAAEEGSVADLYYAAWKQRNQAEYEDIKDKNDVSGGDVSDGNAAVGESGTQGDIIGSTHVVANSAVVFIDSTYLQAQGGAQAGVSAGDKEQVNKGTDIPKYTMAFDKILADQAFYKSQNVENYVLKDGITQIGEFSFARSNISAICIPQGVETIGYGAFYHCDYLRSVEIPNSVTYIAPKAFAETQWLNSWLNGTGSEDFLIVGDGILLAYRGDDSYVTIPDEVERIAPEAFAGNRNLIAVTLPDSLTDIGEDAFASCTNLKTVSGGENVKYIRDRAFYGCPLETAHVGEKVEYLGLQSFDFSTTGLSVSQKVVVFDTEADLPKASYELTAERLSNEAARGMLLGDTGFVVVDKLIHAEELQNTILDAEKYSFKGVVCYISSREQGTVNCIATTYTKEEYEKAYIPEYISIDGKNYQVTQKENITVFGTEPADTVGSILVKNQKTEQIQNVSAVLEANTGSYTLEITDSQNAYDALQTAYEAVYREELPENTLCADICLKEEKTGVNISRLGSQKLSITMTLPDTVIDGSLRILTTDRNGQLENVAYIREGDTVTFSVTHLSPFAFVKSTVLQTTSGRLDASPDTGDFWHPKYFLAAALASMSVLLFLVKKRP